MKWKKRQREIARLRSKHRGERPDYSETAQSARVSISYPSLTSTGVSKICSSPSKTPELTLPGVYVGTPHKQGPMVMTRDELPWAGGKKS